MNVLLVPERRSRLTGADSAHFLSLLRALPIRIEQECTLHTCEKVLSLARTHRLSSYDASYLELAMRHSRDLCTLDERLLHAAEAAGVDVVR